MKYDEILFHGCSYQIVLHCNRVMVVKYAIEGAIDAIVQIVHNSVQLAGGIAHLALGMNLADQCICRCHKEATWFGDYLNTFVGKILLHCTVHCASQLYMHSDIFDNICNLSDCTHLYKVLIIAAWKAAANVQEVQIVAQELTKLEKVFCLLDRAFIGLQFGAAGANVKTGARYLEVEVKINLHC